MIFDCVVSNINTNLSYNSSACCVLNANNEIQKSDNVLLILKFLFPFGECRNEGG